MNDWRPILENYAKTGEWDLSFRDNLTFFTVPGKPQHSPLYMTAYIVPLIVASYAVQYIVQDCFVGWAYSRVLGCVRWVSGSRSD